MKNGNAFRLDSLLSLYCCARSAHTTIQTPRHYLALSTRHPDKNSKVEIERMKNGIQKNTVEKKSCSVWHATAYNKRLWRQSGCLLAESFAGI